MKIKLRLLLALLFCSFISYAQLPLTGKWRYSFSDDKASAALSFDDSDWKTKEGNKLNWDSQELKGTDNKIWIRKKVVIPSTLKKELEKTGELMLYLGRVKQEDKAYFNGKQIGETNSGDIKRAYLLDKNAILWDQENVIAVRITHWGSNSAVEEEPVIMAAKPENVFIMRSKAEGVTTEQSVKNKNASYIATIHNEADRTVKANLVAVFYDINQKKVKMQEQKISIAPGENAFSFPYTSPSSFLKVRYTLSIPAYAYTASWNDLYGYDPVSYTSQQPVVAYRVKEAFVPAQFEKVKLEGWLGEKLKANKEMRLQKVEEAELLAGFINKPGVHPWIGEHVGKYLEAACYTYQNTKDEALKIQIDRIVQQLIAAQLPDGYLGTYEEDSQWTSWDVWSHKYGLVGLLAYYEMSGYKPALVASQKIGDLLYKRFGDKPGQKNIVKAGAHVGMAATSVIDPMTDLYRFTGKKAYLDFCYYITKSYNTERGPRILSTLDSLGRVDKTANAKAYEMMSNLVGLVKLYRVTADRQFLKPVVKAWNDIKEKRLYITGTTSSFEHFQDDHVLPAENKDHMGEGCVTTTWVQLNYQLLGVFGEMKYVDELERAVYNHLIGAENPQTGCVSYYTPLMGVKPYSCSITCCMSSVPRGIAMIPLLTNGKIKGSPAFLLYHQGSYKTVLANGNLVEFITQTKFPEAGDVTIEVNPAAKEKFAVLLRYPHWSSDFTVKVNGAEQPLTGKEAVSIDRVWAKGDKINISFSMPVKVLDGGISYPGSIAIQRGPQVLVFDKNLNPNVKGDFSIQENAVQLQEAASLLPAQWAGSQAYQLKAKVNGENRKIVLVPYADASQTGGEVTTWIKRSR